MFALFAHSPQTTELSAVGYIDYGAGDFDGQNSGHDFYGVSSSPTTEPPGSAGSCHVVTREGAMGSMGERQRQHCKECSEALRAQHLTLVAGRSTVGNCVCMEYAATGRQGVSCRQVV